MDVKDFVPNGNPPLPQISVTTRFKVLWYKMLQNDGNVLMHYSFTYVLTIYMHLVSTYGSFTLDVKSMLIENLGGILGSTHYQMGNNLMLSECQLNIKFSWQVGLSPK